MKTVIITEGGRNIGMGHLTRCLSICQAFEETGAPPEFIVNGDKTAESVLHGKKYTAVNWLEDAKKAYELADGADIAIVDSYLANRGFYEGIAAITGIALYIDDNQRLDYPAGVVLNGNIYAGELAYPTKENVEHLLGSKYIPLRKDFWDVPRRSVEDNIRSVMITFGGDDSRNMTRLVLVLLRKNYPGIRKNVIIGSGFKNVGWIEKEADKNTFLIRSPGAAEMKKIMLESDIALSAAGQTLYELSRTGLPAVTVAVADNQIRSAEGWKKEGFIEYAGWWQDAEVSINILKGIELLKSKKLRSERSLTGQKFVDGRGSVRVRDFLLERVKNAVKQT